MQESVSFIKCLISGVSRGFSPAGCVPELWVGLRFLEIGAGGLEKLHPSPVFVGLGVPPPHKVSVAPSQPGGGCSEGTFWGFLEPSHTFFLW